MLVYIPAAPLTQINAVHLASQRDVTRLGKGVFSTVLLALLFRMSKAMTIGESSISQQ